MKSLLALSLSFTVIHACAQSDPPCTARVVAGFNTTFRGDGVAARNAQLLDGRSPVFDATGNLIFADTRNHRIRRITPNGFIETVAGTGQEGFSGEGGQ